jgi:hypothetical protein
MIEPIFCSGLADLASRYQGFIVDQWGVLHDGARPTPTRSTVSCGCARRVSGSCCSATRASARRSTVRA